MTVYDDVQEPKLSVETESGGVGICESILMRVPLVSRARNGLLFPTALLRATKVRDVYRDTITQLWLLWGTELNRRVICNADELPWATPHMLHPVARSNGGPKKLSGFASTRDCSFRSLAPQAWRGKKKIKKVVRKNTGETKDGATVVVRLVGYAKLQNP